MAFITVKHHGNFQRSEKFLKYMRSGKIFDVLEREAKKGVAALSSVTPKDTGTTAASWGFEIQKTGKTYSIIWTNDVVIPGHGPLVIMLQYGHGTGTGGYVQGRDFINPAIKPVFDAIANSVWKEVQNA